MLATTWLFPNKESSPVGGPVIGVGAYILCGLIGGAITGYPLMRALQQSSIQSQKLEIKDESSSSRLG
jgi:hypothetical protein